MCPEGAVVSGKEAPFFAGTIRSKYNCNISQKTTRYLQNTYLHALQKCPFRTILVALSVTSPGVNTARRSCVRNRTFRWGVKLMTCSKLYSFCNSQLILGQIFE